MAERGEEEKGVVEEGMAVVDFDMLCATVALQAQGFSAERRAKSAAAEEEEDGGDYGGVQRMWEGDVLDCFEDRRIAIQAACCPCYRFGKNMRRANLGSCFLQGTVYFMIRALTLFSLIAFGITKWHVFVYTGVGSACLMGVYLGYFRTRIRKQFNIRGSDSSVDDCVNHLICPCCTLCQESRTLEMNNVHSGVWHGRGETICLGSGIGGEGIKPSLLPIRSPELCSMERASNTSELLPIRSPELCSMERASNTSEHSWNADTSQSNPLVAATQSVQVL